MLDRGYAEFREFGLAEVHVRPYWYFHYREADSALSTSAVDKEKLNAHHAKIAECVAYS